MDIFAGMDSVTKAEVIIMLSYDSLLPFLIMVALGRVITRSGEWALA